MFSVLAQQAQATDPDLTTITPFGAKLGTEVVVTFNGSRLEDAVEILCNDPGLEFSELTVDEKAKGRKITAKVKVLGNSPLGVHRLRIRSKSGITKIANFFVGPYTVVDEKEPNTDFTAPQTVGINVTVHGRIDNEDVDYYAVEAKKGQRLTVEVEGLRMGTYYMGAAFFDPYVAIMNASRFELDARDDHALTHQDAFASIIVPEDGTYYIQVRDASYGGHGASLYRAHIGNYARPIGVIPAGGKPGETLTVKLLGDVAGDFDQQVVFPSKKPMSFGIFALSNNLVTPTCNPLWVSSLDNVLEVEPNEAHAQATPMAIPSAANGYISSETDIDYFKVAMKKDQQVDVDVIARRVRSAIDSVLTIYNAKGGRVAGDDDRKRPDSWVRFKAPADGDYFIRVHDQLGNGGPDYHYRIEVTAVVPKMKITSNEVRRYVQPDVEIPVGRRVAFLASVSRENFGGAVTFTAGNLPAGVTIEAPATWASDGVVPIMFHAPAESTLGAKFATVTGTWQNPSNAEQKVSTNLVQDHLRIRGRNQGNYVWRESLDTIPIVISQHIPFDVKIIEPKAPVVRGGSMLLKVVATRDEGFDADIQLLVLQNAPGVNSSRSIKILKGQTEALIPINASGNAPIRESHITVRAIAKVGNGSVEICTPFIKLRVADMYMKLKYVTSAVERGSTLDFPITIENVTPFEGKAKVELIGLPNKVTTEVLEITKDSKDITFSIKTDATSPLGEHKNLFCKITVIENGEPVLHNIGSGRLRLNNPPPVKVEKKPVPKAAPKKAAVVVKKKVLSRLEMLREQQKELRENSK
ncbi:MAG: PPC domain-containing protein [Planctomycetaceae bacterium]|nr:PPC domain-containing protein [Planctomycetaceae bacterium]